MTETPFIPENPQLYNDRAYVYCRDTDNATIVAFFSANSLSYILTASIDNTLNKFVLSSLNWERYNDISGKITNDGIPAIISRVPLDGSIYITPQGNLLSSAIIVTNTTSNFVDALPLQAMIDNDFATFYRGDASAAGASSRIITFDMQKLVNVNKISYAVVFTNANGANMAITIDYSSDNSNWTTILSDSCAAIGTKSFSDITTGATMRYVRVSLSKAATAASNHFYDIYEIQLT